jgi:serine O-acetyltransferase
MAYTSNLQKKRKSLWQLIKSDLARYHVTDRRSYLTMLIICPGSIAGIVYRIGHWIWTYEGRLALPVFLLRVPYIVVKRLTEIVTGIALQPQATIGEGLYIGHGGSVFVGGKVVMGDNCNLSHEVTIGVGGRGDRRGMPVIGDRVYIAPGAKLFGQITVGNDVAIGANAVVTKSIPDRAVAVGIPAQVISREGSFDFVFYKGMESDPARRESYRQYFWAKGQAIQEELSPSAK